MEPRPAGWDRGDRFAALGRRVLLVSSDDRLRTEVSGWLEAAGHDVMSCPGPRHPRHSCVGVRGESCALERGAEVCVLDLDPAGGQLVDRSNRAELLRLYSEGGRPVVVLVDGDDRPELEPRGGVVFLDRTIDPGALASTVRDLTR